LHTSIKENNTKENIHISTGKQHAVLSLKGNLWVAEIKKITLSVTVALVVVLDKNNGTKV
jgi:hypothetical protein